MTCTTCGKPACDVYRGDLICMNCIKQTPEWRLHHCGRCEKSLSMPNDGFCNSCWNAMIVEDNRRARLNH